MQKKKFTYTVLTRVNGTHYVHTNDSPELFRDEGTGFRVLQFGDDAWFRLNDVVSFTRFINKPEKAKR